MTQKTNKNKYILENVLLNIFKFYILKYITKFLQSHDNNKKKKILLSFRGTPVKNQLYSSTLTARSHRCTVSMYNYI